MKPKQWVVQRIKVATLQVGLELRTIAAGSSLRWVLNTSLVASHLRLHANTENQLYFSSCLCSSSGKITLLHHDMAWAATQKSSSKDRLCMLSAERPFMTPAFWYSPTLFSKKFVLPCRESISIQSKGLGVL